MGNDVGKENDTQHRDKRAYTKKKVNANKLCETKNKVKFELNNANSISNVKYIFENCIAKCLATAGFTSRIGIVHFTR